MTSSSTHRVGVLIATSGRRTRLLAERCLPSVYGQTGVSPTLVRVALVDDNADPAEFADIQRAVEMLRGRLGLPEGAFCTAVIRNTRTRAHSGTGAWNTGLDHLGQVSPPPTWVAILDDDDEFLPGHLDRCLGASDEAVDGIFERIEWVRASGIEQRPFELVDLSPEAFFVGNPGVQGSNLFIRLGALLAIGGFDETLPNTTDRDLMIRLLRHVAAQGRAVRTLPNIGARYFDHDGPRVNTDLERKRRGLDLFYAKHAGDFNVEQLRQSLDRARAFFGYDGIT